MMMEHLATSKTSKDTAKFLKMLTNESNIKELLYTYIPTKLHFILFY